jgi:hypothetical protein
MQWKTYIISIMSTLFLLLTFFAIGTQEISPRTPRSGTTEHGIVGKLDDAKKADNSSDGSSQSLPPPTCNNCPTCCPEKQPNIKTKEEKAKEDSVVLPANLDSQGLVF